MANNKKGCEQRSHPLSLSVDIKVGLNYLTSSNLTYPYLLGFVDIWYKFGTIFSRPKYLECRRYEGFLFTFLSSITI